jgi:hypothetical protein
MILSIHIPKTAGTSFGESLKATFGERLMLDYGDWAGFNSPEVIGHRAERTAQMRARRDELLETFDVIHGHFLADKYLGLFPQADFVAFFRDPYQQTLSNYFFMQNNPHLPHPAVKMFHDAKMTILDFLSWDGVPNPHAKFLGSVPVESLAMVGLTEEFSRSMALFKSTFGHDVPTHFVSNVNPKRQGSEYELDTELRKAMDKFRAADLDLYRRAKEVFIKQTAFRSV